MTGGALVIDGALRVDVAVERAAFRLEAAFEAQPGRPLGLVGPNGAGKSTLLAAVAGLIPVASGSVALGDRLLNGVPAEERRIGFVFQDFLLFPHLTVRDNVAFARRVAGAGRAAARVEAEPWLARFDLEELALRHPPELSGGQRQRVALARALASGPELLLLDEPMAALDVEIRDEVRADLARHLADVRVPTVVVTHDAADLVALAGDVVVLEAGRVTQTGRVDAVRAAPATAYVARLLGSS